MTLLTLEAGELENLEKIAKGSVKINGVDEETDIMSGIFRKVAGQFHYVISMQSIMITDGQREKFGLKPVKR